MRITTPAPAERPEDEEMSVLPSEQQVEGPQPMEVVQLEPEPEATAESQQAEDLPKGKFTWTIDNFTRSNTKKFYSNVFSAGSCKWQLLVFPTGKDVDHLSMYLDVADSTRLPYGWSRFTQFSLAVVNQTNKNNSVIKGTQHQFSARESLWGFTSFMPLSDLYDPSNGYLVNDTCVLEAEVTVHKAVDYWTHNSKKETGYVGLKNQGATCYMNSLIQFLYHIPYFRKAVYLMPTTENDLPSGSIPLALQRLFYKLQYSDSSIATEELTKSFGWVESDRFLQHDVQEFNRVLCQKLEDKMKGTVVEGTIKYLFEGHYMNFIECINVDYKSTRMDSFYDLQLDVKNCKDVYASFDKYVEVERLEGDDQYQAEKYGLQDAKKYVLFVNFPPVLQLHLKRFEYDKMRNSMFKINDRYEYPLQLDLDRGNRKYLSPDANRSVRNLYTLHSVIVHTGGVHGGHYYALIRPTLSDQWFKFDDARVSKEDMKRALEEQYGGEEEAYLGFENTPFSYTKNSNPYILVYIRESDKDKILYDVDEKDIAEQLRIRLGKEQEGKEHKKKEIAEAHRYTIIKVARNEDFAEQIGCDRYFDLVEHGKACSFRIQKHIPFSQFKEEVAKKFNIPVQFQRFWLWDKRQNHTYRPSRPLTPAEEALSVGQLTEVVNKEHNAVLKLYLEIEFKLLSKKLWYWGSAGLDSLCNSCFVNIAISLAHTPRLISYFLNDYHRDASPKNPRIENGELALAFAELQRKLWVPAPREDVRRLLDIKLALYAQQNGFGLQDSQDILRFLLDGLHENLNRVRVKKDIKVSAQHDSIIVDIFQGEYKSTITCAECASCSVTFDLFTYLSLPVPSIALRTMSITVFSGDTSGPVVYTINLPEDGNCKDLIQALGCTCFLKDNETLYVVKVYADQVLHLEDTIAISLIRDCDKVIAYRLLTDEEDLPLLMFVHQRLVHGIGNIFSSKKAFGVPFVTRHRHGLNCNAPIIRNLYFRLLYPFLLSSIRGNIDAINEFVGDDVRFEIMTGNIMIDMDKPFPPTSQNKFHVRVCWERKALQILDLNGLDSFAEVYKSRLFTKRSREHIPLHSCLEAFLREKKQTEWCCPGCKKQAQKKQEIWRLPDFLVLHLRYSSQIQKGNVNRTVKFPIHNLNLSGYTVHVTAEDCRYDLYAVCSHKGRKEDRHYTAIVFHPEEKRWYDFDHQRICPLAEENSLETSGAYVLFYRRVA